MMSAVVQSFPKAFSVSFLALKRWDPNNFHDIQWHWPPSVMAPIGSVLSSRKEKVDRSSNNFSAPRCLQWVNPKFMRAN